ncbi:HAD-superfamily hydrolase, subfamily IIA [Blastocladiella britannica]|nr:HAD-superfamily hydrolase, subfamily IIA [Blastocladiella britannica]
MNNNPPDSPIAGPDHFQKLIAHAALSDEGKLALIRSKKAFILDMDGVIYHGNHLLDGVADFIAWIRKEGKQFIFLTNNSIPTPRELKDKMHRLGVDVEESNFYTSSLCTAKFLSTQKPNGSCYVIGEAGLHFALYSHGFTMNDINPDFVVVGDGFGINYEKLAKAVKLVSAGAKLIGTNPDVAAVTESSLIPACGAFIAAIEQATGKKAFYLGKPSSLMMRGAQRMLNLMRNEVCMVGDRMDTDILGGLLAELDTVLVLTGVTQRKDLDSFSYQPYLVLDRVSDILPH